MASSNVLQPILDGDETVKIHGTLKYQACDDKICYLPQTVPLEWTLKLEALDRERVPEPIQHKPAASNGK
jgi:hypothetical protein